jgi:hypothetical protein
MIDDTLGIIATSSGAPSTIALDLSCIHCGYNLRTLRADGVCPECGHAVRASLRYYQAEPVRWLTSVSGGTATLVVTQQGFIAAVALIGVGAALDRGRDGFLPWPLFLAAVVCIWAILSGIGLLGLTAKGGGAPGRWEGISTRRLVRLGLAGFVLMSASAALTDGEAHEFTSVLTVVLLPFLVVGLLRHLGNVMHEIAQPGLRFRARVLSWALAAVCLWVLLTSGFLIYRGGSPDVWIALGYRISALIALGVWGLGLLYGFLLLIRARDVLREARNKAEALSRELREDLVADPLPRQDHGDRVLDANLDLPTHEQVDEHGY